MKRYIKIGLISALSLIILIIAPLYFYYIWNTYPIHAEFNNAAGLSRLDDVRLAGMRIGSVWDVYLTRGKKVHAVMFVYKRYRNFIPVDSRAKIISAGMSSGKYSVDITPGVSSVMLPNQAYVRTEKTVELQDLMARAEVLAYKMDKSFSALDDLLGDPVMVSALKKSALNLEIASGKSVVLLSSLQGIVSDDKARVAQVLASVESTASNFEALSRNLRRLADASAPKLGQTTTDVGKAAHDFTVVSQQLRSIMENINPDDIQATLKSVKAASEDIEVTSRHLRILAEDPSLSAQGKKMLEDLQKALSGAADVVDQVKKLLSASKP